MSKLLEWTLNGILLALPIVGIVFAGSLVRAHPLLPIVLLLLTLVLSILFCQVPDYFGPGHLPTMLKYSFYTSLIAAFMCLAYYSKGKVAVEKLFYAGKVNHYDYEIDTDQGPGSATAYYLDKAPTSIDNLIGFAFFALLIGIPYVVYQLGRKVAPGSG